MDVRKNRKGTRRAGVEVYVFAILSLVSFALLLFSTRSVIYSIRDAGLSAYSGIRGGVHGISSFISRTVLSVQELAVLRGEYAELAGRITRYEQLERSAAEIFQENARLKEQLGFLETRRYEHIPAQVIGRDPDNLYSALVIDKGSRHKIKPNMPVIAFQNGAQAIVGKVIQAGFVESLVMPIYDNSSFVSARIIESRYDGIIEGQGSADRPLFMRYITKRARDEINIGDVVATSGLGGVFPQGITLGRISRVIFEEYETSIGAEIEAAIDFSRLEYVFVIAAEDIDG
jgi:rod shape-determining protein MreC